MQYTVRLDDLHVTGAHPLGELLVEEVDKVEQLLAVEVAPGEEALDAGAGR